MMLKSEREKYRSARMLKNDWGRERVLRGLLVTSKRGREIEARIKSERDLEEGYWLKVRQRKRKKNKNVK